MIPSRRSETGDDAEGGREATADLLRAALRREASAIHPAPDGLARILAAAHRAGTVPPQTPARRRPLVLPDARAPRPHRPGRWLPVLAAAAAVLVVTGGLGLARFGMIQAPGLASVVGGPAASGPPSRPPAADPLPVYLVEEQHDRWALVREFTPTTLTEPSARLVAALRLAVAGDGTDPQHTSVWVAAGLPVGAAAEIEATADAAGVVVRLPAALLGAPTVGAGPPPASLAVQQLVWTATATTHDTGPVRIGGPTDGARLFGSLALDRRFSRSAGDPRAPVWVSSLVNDQHLTPGRAVIHGDAVTVEPGAVAWRLLGPDGAPVATGAAALHREDGGASAPGERGVWQVTVQLPGSGRYVFEVRQAWPGAASTDPPWTDTKTLLVA